jgi:hypothetical protein
MYARVVTFNLKPDSWDDALDALDAITERIGAFPGLKSWTNIGNRETGKGLTVAVYESKDAMEAVTSQVDEILSGFGQYFSAPPTIDVGDVLAHIDNA